VIWQDQSYVGAFSIFALMVKIIVTDLDGTLLTADQQVSPEDFSTLVSLGNQGIIRVIATGRSPYSFQNVIPLDFPIDYLVFSSGSGIMDYRTREILYSRNLHEKNVHSIARALRDEGVSFKVLAPVPENHHYVYFQTGELHPDFIRRMETYRGFEKPISFDPPNFGESCQFLIILPPDPARYEELKCMFPGVKVIRATSPLDHKSIWMEIYHGDVSKGNAVQFLSDLHSVKQSEIMGIGNDYNDIDLLEFVGLPFVVSNAPDELKAIYRQVGSNNQSGFSEAVRGVLGKGDGGLQ
jgi:Cof subfamily protein (haloacid dehalogenase superfamily)